MGAGKKIARHLGEELHAVVVGKDIGECAGPLGEAGADKVYLIESEHLAIYTTDGYANALTELIGKEKPSLVLLAHNAKGKDLAPALAQKLSAGQISDVVDVKLEAGIQFKRPNLCRQSLFFC